jgi:nicotinic acid mononucleotide adenylyltransferase
LGADAYKSLNKWCKWQELTDYAHIVVFNRNSFLEQKLPDDLSLWQKNKIKPIDDFCNIDKKQGNIFFITNFSNANSSINIRKEKNIGKEYDFCNNMKKLNLFIAKENLYNRI